LRSALTRVTEPLEYGLSSPESYLTSQPVPSTSQILTSQKSSKFSEESTKQKISSTRCSAEVGGSKSPSCKRRKLHRRKRKAVDNFIEEDAVSIYSLPQELILLFIENLDVASSLAFLRCSKHFYCMLNTCESFWRILCQKLEFSISSCLEEMPQQRIGFAGNPMYLNREEEEGLGKWTKIWKRGIKMRRNIASSNFQGWRLYSSTSCPMVELTSDLDLNQVKSKLGKYPRLSHNDDIKLDWDDKYLVVFHFLRGETETCTIRLWDIEKEPKFVYQVDKGAECITDKVAIHGGYVVIVPSWPLDTNALVMTLDVNNNMSEKGRYIFPDEESRVALDNHWDHTQLRVVRCHALVTCRAPDWRLLVTSLPDCQLLRMINLTVSNLYECHQIRSYKGTAVVLFSAEKTSSAGEECGLVTVDVSDTGAEVRSTHFTKAVTEVALYTEPEEIYLVMKDGNLNMYDATNKEMRVKITNPLLKGSNRGIKQTILDSCDYQLFVNGKEQICIVQSAPEATCGRSVSVYSYHGDLMYTINLDLVKYGLCRDESVCVYTHSAFLLVADSKRFVMFDVKTGNFISILIIPTHLERSKGKEEKDCMFDQSSLGMFVFDDNRLIAVHDYERSFPAILDIYTFW